MIYEFLYRGPTPENGNKPAWHVVIAEAVQAFGKTELRTLGPLTPAMAQARGFALADIVAEINAEALKDRDALAVELDATKTELEAEKRKTAQLERVATVQADQIAALTSTTETATKTVAKKG